MSSHLRRLDQDVPGLLEIGQEGRSSGFELFKGLLFLVQELLQADPHLDAVLRRDTNKYFGNGPYE